MKDNILGIDISKRKFDVALADEGTPIRRNFKGMARGVFENTPEGFRALLKWLEDRGIDDLHACMEATGSYGDALAMFLFDCGFKVSIVNPYQIACYARRKMCRTKTDRNDAAIIAGFCRAERPREWRPLRTEDSKLKALTSRLRDLEKMRQQEKNRIQTPGLDLEVKQSIRDMIDILDSKIEEILGRMREHVSSHEDLKIDKELLCSIPGIGEKTAMMLMGLIGDWDRFENGRQLAAWAGLVPSQRQSGDSVRGKSYLTSYGQAEVRRLFYMPALSAMRYNPVIMHLTIRLRAKNKNGKQIVVASMHKLLRIAYGVIKSGRPFDVEFYPQVY